MVIQLWLLDKEMSPIWKAKKKGYRSYWFFSNRLKSFISLSCLIERDANVSITRCWSSNVSLSSSVFASICFSICSKYGPSPLIRLSFNCLSLIFLAFEVFLVLFGFCSVKFFLSCLKSFCYCLNFLVLFEVFCYF